MYHFTYRITNIKLRKHYYGCHSSKLEPINVLGKKYFSSSTDDDFIKDQRLHQQDYEYKVVHAFKTRVEAVSLEIKLHNKFNVGVNESFYNKAKQTSTGFDTTGTTRSQELKNKQSELMSGANNPFYDKSHSSETIEKLKNLDRSNAGKKISESKTKIMDDGRTLQDHITEKRLLKMDYESSGKKSGATRLLRGTHKGAKNKRSKKINIYNAHGELMFACHGDFIKTCEDNNLPKKSLVKSYQYDGEKIYQFTRQSDITQVGEKYNIFKNWYAVVQ